MAKKEEEKLEQLESLNTHRQFFYLLSLYGCYDKTKLKNKLNRSKSTVDTEIRLLKYYIDENKRELKQSLDNTRTYNIPYFRYAPCENELINLFRQKNFTTKQINKDFLLLMALMKADVPLSLLEISNRINQFSDLHFLSPDDTIGDVTLRENMDELLALDFVTETKEKNKNMYKIKENINLSIDQWIRLHEALSFFRNDGYFNSLGYFCQTNIEEILYDQKVVIPMSLEYPFAYKRHFPHNILEDDMIMTLMEAWEEKVCVVFDYQKKGKEQSYRVVPLKIITNPGRNYLYAYDLKEKKPISLLIWKIEKVKKCNDENCTFKPEDYESSLALLEKSWSLTRLYLVENPLNASTKLVEIDFFPRKGSRISDGKPVLWNRLQREKRQGSVEIVNENHYTFSVSVLEPIELIPWIRSFGSEAKVRPSTEHNLVEILDKHRKELAKTYGLISSI